LSLLDEPHGGALVEQWWSEHRMGEGKIGHQHVEVRRVDRGDQHETRVVVTDSVELLRYGQWIRQTLISVDAFAADGKLLGFAYRLDADEGAPEQFEARVEADGETLRWQRKTGESVQQKSSAWKASRGGLMSVMWSLRREPMRPGETREILGFVALMDQPLAYRLRAGDAEFVNVDGNEMSLVPVHVEMQAGGRGERITHWIDGQGNIWKTVSNVLRQSTWRADEQVAKRANDLDQVDLGLGTKIAFDAGDGDLPGGDRYAYVVRCQAQDPATLFLNSSYQRVESLDERTAKITVWGKGGGARGESTGRAISGRSSEGVEAADRQPSGWIESDSAEVLAMAEVATSGARSDREVALALEGYVHTTLRQVDFSQLFSTAREAAVRKQGDCSEHAVLLAALCRARGIPARVAVGLVYSPEDQGFLFHMWNEVWVDDRWYPLDATLGRGGTEADRLLMVQSSFADGSAYRFLSPVVQALSDVSFVVAESVSTSAVGNE
jgi:hypothetical protein